MLFKRHYHLPVLLKQVLRFYTIFFHLLAKTVSLKRYRPQIKDFCWKNAQKRRPPSRFTSPVPVQPNKSSQNGHRPRNKNSLCPMQSLHFLRSSGWREKWHVRLKPFLWVSVPIGFCLFAATSLKITSMFPLCIAWWGKKDGWSCKSKL